HSHPAALHAGRVSSGREPRAVPVHPRLRRAVRPLSRRARDRDGVGVHLFHVVHGRLGHHDSRARRPADADPDQRPILRARPARPFDAREARAAVWQAKWELMTPVVAFVALFSGWATPVEAAAVTAAYVLAVVTLFHRDLRIVRDVPRVMTECGLLIGGIVLIL